MDRSDVERVTALLDRYNSGDIDAIEELIAPSYFTYAPGPDEPTATEVYRQFAADFKTAAPDLTVQIPDLAPGDDGLLHGTTVIGGTQTGPLFGVPPLDRAQRFEIPVTLKRIHDRYAVNLTLPVPEAIGVLRALDMINPPDKMHLPPPHPVIISDFLIKILFTGQVADKPCPHLAAARVTRPETDRCSDCGPDDIWPALRMCLTCGHVGCCDTSTNKHARTHWEATGHPLMRSIRMDEGWIWCYADDAAFQKRTLDRIQARLDDA
jgi:hypothetical protein